MKRKKRTNSLHTRRNDIRIGEEIVKRDNEIAGLKDCLNVLKGLFETYKATSERSMKALENENKRLKQEVANLKDKAAFYYIRWGKYMRENTLLKMELKDAKKRKWWMIWG